MSDAVSASYAAEAGRRIKELRAALEEHTACIIAAIEARDTPPKNAERELLMEVAGWIVRLEDGLASDGGRASTMAEKLRRLIDEVAAMAAP